MGKPNGFSPPLSHDSFIRIDGDSSSEASSLLRHGDSLRTRRLPSFVPLSAVCLFALVYLTPIIPDRPTAHTFFAIVSFAFFLWITEPIPSFATAYLITLLCVWFRVGLDSASGDRIPAVALAESFAGAFMDPRVFTLLGSIAISHALRKTNISARITRLLLRAVSPRPAHVLFALMFLNLLGSAAFSVASSTTIVLSLALPVLQALGPRCPFSKALLFGIAWSANCAGMMNGTIHNQIAMSILSNFGAIVSQSEWVCIGVPVGIFICFLYWIYLRLSFGADQTARIMILPTAEHEEWSRKHTETFLCTIVTFVMWTFDGFLSEFFGHIGIVSLLPIVWLFSRGILTTADFNSFPWSTLTLAGGAIVLSESAQLSGLLNVFVVRVIIVFSRLSSLQTVIAIIAPIMIGSIFNWSIVASAIFPVIAAVGEECGHLKSFVILSALALNSAQLFHVSSLANALVSSVFFEGEDVTCQRSIVLLRGHDFLFAGLPSVVISTGVLLTLGLALTALLGF
jgi:phosphate transporter